MDLFKHGRQAQIQQEAPLAHRMRPRTLDEYAGQQHIVGPGRLLRRAIQADQLSSLIFYGPPGTGKTTLAMVIANSTQSHFITINAVLAGVKEIREAIASALERRELYGQRTTLFVDEVHRWNKAQQDALLPHVENGTIILIGATTENPYFEVNKALVSRSRIFQLKPLTEDDLLQIARQALADAERGYGALPVHIDDDALAHLVDVANGDARGVLNALELAVETTGRGEDGRIHITLAVAEESIQRRAVLYDKEGDVHYDTISAFIKSLRGSDPDAALYWMAKMIYAGEDPRFIFRRMGILAGEDVGMADPQAMGVVMSCWEAFERIGMPEGRFHLALAATYLATAPKSNSAFAFFDALAAVEKERESDVPNHLKDGNRDKEGFGHGEGYLYPHAYRDHWVAQQYLPQSLQGKLFYQPSDQGYERQIRDEVARRREAQLAAMLETDDWGLEIGEILSTSPENKAKDAWLQRTISRVGENLAHQRERLFELAAVQRHHLLLDVNAGSGLLTWEAVRRAPEGGVWALAADAAAGEALRQMAEKLPELERPSILIGSPSELNYLLELRSETNLEFDRILARNLLQLAIDDWQLTIGNLAGWLADDGRLCLIQTVPRHTQRLYNLVQWPDAALRDKVAAAEEAIYHDETDSLVNWDEGDVTAWLETANFAVQTHLERQTEQRQMTSAHLQRWFALDGRAERPSYGQRLQAAGLSATAVQQVSKLYVRQLQDQVVTWETAVLYAIGKPIEAHHKNTV
ncbi:MAG: AAA family ATPase [Ardenticatenaceae bacterium]|nr:AAA family ATPase [Anaerolineales bacterium]MCB8922377.1 AAA family ATPase [Ardenticatenaceae bacterium]MCB8991309.1 AAA family ATPase [Ardenticatenaceae bacterium]